MGPWSWASATANGPGEYQEGVALAFHEEKESKVYKPYYTRDEQPPMCQGDMRVRGHIYEVLNRIHSGNPISQHLNPEVTANMSQNEARLQPPP
ncbi:hypothetical protein PDE_08464 [Penicillium oxalicum 114-2]|uniref:Uncharacterized protein n=1 Tax=Penicillium oxalicum (strain 114-2 / CGMCC 5302) TaxID=933388 RepID=S8BEL3_PENO1|nr:hypothetical protein PDE_08464 [Penicillium oxalicum 114-2]